MYEAHSLWVLMLVHSQKTVPDAEGEIPDARACWEAGLAVGRAEGAERMLGALREALYASGITGHVAEATLRNVERRALAA